MSRKQTPWPLLLASLLVAYVLAILPLPERVEPLAPFWLALVVVYWSLEMPDRAGIGFAWLAGLGLDLVTGGLLGEHALRLTIMVYIVLRFRRRLRFILPWQQVLAVLALLLNDRIVTLWIRGVMDYPWPGYPFWLAPFIGMMVWPVVVVVLDSMRRRFKMA